MSFTLSIDFKSKLFLVGTSFKNQTVSSDVFKRFKVDAQEMALSKIEIRKGHLVGHIQRRKSEPSRSENVELRLK